MPSNSSKYRKICGFEQRFLQAAGKGNCAYYSTMLYSELSERQFAKRWKELALNPNTGKTAYEMLYISEQFDIDSVGHSLEIDYSMLDVLFLLDKQGIDKYLMAIDKHIVFVSGGVIYDIYRNYDLTQKVVYVIAPDTITLKGFREL